MQAIVVKAWGNTLVACLQAKGCSIVAAQLSSSHPWDLNPWMFPEAPADIMDNLDFSSARILLLGTQQVAPQQSVLWLEHDAVPSSIWEPPPPGLAVLSATWAKVRQPRSCALMLLGGDWPVHVVIVPSSDTSELVHADVVGCIHVYMSAS